MSLIQTRETARPEVAAERNGQLDLLRATAIAMVLVYHLVQTSPIGLPPFLRFVRAGQYGVDLFFVLSGWLIGTLYWKERSRFGDIRLLRFWARRWLRTIPPYLAALALAWLAVRIERHEPFNWGYLVFIQNYYDRLPYFLVSWSLCIEEHFYLFLPLLLVWAARRRWSITLLFLCLIVGAPVCRWWLSLDGTTPTFGFELTATHLRLEGLLLGFWAAYTHCLAESAWPTLRKWSSWAALAALVCLGTILFLDGVWMYRLGLTVMAVGLAATLVRLAGAKPGAIASSPIVKAIALASYSVYLTHPLMLHLARKALNVAPRLPWYLYFPVALGFVTAGGALFYIAVERTSIRLRDRWVPRRKGVVITRETGPC